MKAAIALLADSLAPIDITLAELQLHPFTMDGVETGLLWWSIQETPDLRRAHNWVNRALSRQLDNVQADHDGSEYHFHLTVMIGGQPLEVYRRCFKRLEERKGNLRFTAPELTLFGYDEPLRLAGDTMTYSTLPLRGARDASGKQNVENL